MQKGKDASGGKMQPEAPALHARPDLLRGGRKPGGQRKTTVGIHPERPRPAHGRQGHRPENVREMLLPAVHPFAFHAHVGGGQGGLVPFQQKQIGPPGIVPAGRFQNLVCLGGVNEALGREVGASKKAGLLGVLPVGRFGNTVKKF